MRRQPCACQSSKQLWPGMSNGHTMACKVHIPAAQKQFWTEFLELYQSLPSLWKVKSEEYANRMQKTRDYEKLVAKMEEIEPFATREMVTKKINSFRTSYRKELKKVKSSIEAGCTGDQVYTSSLWYFNKLRFLDDQLMMDVSQMHESNLPSKRHNHEIDPLEYYFDENDISGESFDGYEDRKEDIVLHSATTIEDIVRPHKQPRIESPAPSTPTVTPLYNPKADCLYLQQPNQKLPARPSSTRQEDRHDIYCKYVAMKMRGFSNEQRIQAERLINSALYLAETESLNDSHNIIVTE